ncbi:hypothetical protein, partial [Nocardia sp. NPDC049707]|uniref:hypothetical protein n=1 Tax=Nocardia sp. NPDC049707 TaxID=3154735 RepID=UPI00341BCB16
PRHRLDQPARPGDRYDSRITHPPVSFSLKNSAHPVTADTNPTAITAFVCALSGYWARNSRLPAPPRSPNLRVHQAEQARIAQGWLTKRITPPGR